MIDTSLNSEITIVFIDVEKEMRGLEWGRLYETYKNTAYNPQDVSAKVQELYSDPYVKNRNGAFEYILGSSTDTKLLDIRVFDDATNKAVYLRFAGANAPRPPQKQKHNPHSLRNRPPRLGALVSQLLCLCRAKIRN